MNNKLSLKWFLQSMVGAAALVGFIFLGQQIFPLFTMFGKLILPKGYIPDVSSITPFMMQIGGAVALIIPVFFACWKRILSVSQLLVSLVVCDTMIIAYSMLLFPNDKTELNLILSLDFIFRFNALTMFPFFIAIGLCKGLRMLKNVDSK